MSYSYLLDPRTIDFIALEAEATAIANFEPSVVPGLLQTADYIRGVMRGGPHTLGDDLVEQRVKIRLDRQQRLTADAAAHPRRDHRRGRAATPGR